jgi:hypothetical protein
MFLVLAAALIAAAAAPTGRFSPESYLEHVRYLASDELRGRGNGTPGLDKAAEYIAAQFQAAGLKPAGDGETYFQAFTLSTGSKLGRRNILTVEVGDTSKEAKMGEDYLPIGMGKESVIEGEVVFAGYGITAEDLDYDDYRDIDVAGKIVLVMAHTPREKDDSSPFGGQGMTMHGEDNTKAINAKYRQAKAILISQNPANHPDADRDLANPTWGSQVDELGIGTFRINRRLAQQILDTAGKSLLELQGEIDERMKPVSFPVEGLRIRIELDVEQVRSRVRNVAAMLPGQDPGVGDELVVIGAHYDHLGRGGRSSLQPSLIGEIHNGADDNASGTAGLIEVARALAAEPGPRKRSYLFIAFAGEELGLHGSVHWISSAGNSMEKIVAMLNMDMIGRPKENQLLLGGTGTSPAFPGLARSAASAAGLELKLSPSGYGRSDHQPFYSKGIPVLFFFSGLHSDYHSPSDDWDKIDAGGAVRILSMVHDVASALNGMDRRPQFTKVKEPEPPHGGGRGAGYGTWFGSVPDMTSEVEGVLFSDVRPGSPAAKAGLQGGDRMIRFAGKEIKNLMDFTFMLRTHKPGEIVEVVVIRDGSEFTVPVTLGIRR